MKKLVYVSLLPLVFLASCTSEIKADEKENLVKEENSDNEEKTGLLRYEDIDLTNLSQIKSIRYTKGNFSTEIEGYFEGEMPVMFTEKYTIENGNSGTRDYFFKNNQLTHVIDYHEQINMNDDSTLIEESIFFYENSELTKMTYRKLIGLGDFESITPQEQKELPNFNHTAYLHDFLNKKGDFETAFKDIAEYGENGKFLRVGSRNENGYECYIKIDQMNEVLAELENNKKKYQNVLIDLSIAYTDDPFMHLTQIQIIE